jgi:lipoate-protein ligase A
MDLDGPTNMARDESLLETGELGARVYTWDGVWVSLGRFQKPEKALLHATETRWVMRPTGGKAVLHGHDVTIGLAAPLALLKLDSRSVGAAYRRIIEPIIQAMRDAGADADLAERTRFVRSAGHTADCFAHIAPNDVVNPKTGQKICGCALKLTQDAVLVQASLPASPPLVDVGSVFQSPHVAAWSAGLRADRVAEGLASALRELEDA